MLNWPAKDPDEVLDYRWEPVIDAGDTLSSITLERIAGDVVTDSTVEDATGITLVLSGGTDGTNVFRGLASTAGGRTFEEYITLPVASEPDAGLTASLKARYPAFAAVDTATIAYWLTDADRFVNDGWGTDADPARMAYAAHQMSVNDAPGITKTAMELIPAGVTRFRSASMDAALSEAAANRSVNGGWSATRYGQEFAAMLRRNTGGPRLVGYIEPVCGFGW